MPEIPIQNMLGGAAIVAGIVWALMEAIKKAGLPGGSASAISAIMLGPALAVLWTWSHVENHAWEQMVEPGLTGLIGSLAAMGVYKLSSWSPPEPGTTTTIVGTVVETTKTDSKTENKAP